MVHGGISNKAMVKSATEAEGNPNAYYPVKSSDSRLADVSRYGGITSIANSSYALVQYIVKGKTADKDKRIRQLIGVPIYLGNVTVSSKTLFEYLSNKVNVDNAKKVINDFSIVYYPVKFNSTISIDGFTYLLGGATDNYIYLKDFIPLYLSNKNSAYLKKVEKAVGLKDYNEMSDGELIIKKEDNCLLYDELIYKLGDKIFKQKKANIYGVLNDGRSIFEELTVERQCYLIMQIVSWFNSALQTVDLIDLKAVGGTAHAGKLTMKSILTDYDSVFLLERSTLGVFERKVDLLK